MSIYGSKASQEAVANQLKILLEGENETCRTIEIKSFKAFFDNNGKVYEDLKIKYKGEFQLNFKNKTLSFFSKDGKMDELEKEVNEIQNSYLKREKKNVGHGGHNADDCGICGDLLEEPLALLVCSHKFCTACITNQFKCTDITMDFACVSCNADICILDIRRLANFDDELVNEKANMMLGKELMRNKNYAYCKICNQIGRFEAENLMNCMICKKRYCFKCQREPHGSLSC